MNKCPTCGQPIPQRGADLVLAKLRERGDRQLYRGQDGKWYMTYGGGPIDQTVVRELVDSGAVQSCYSDIPDECFHIGKTADLKATQAHRRATGHTRAIVYTDGSIERDYETRPKKKRRLT